MSELRLKLEDAFLPERERLEYRLEMFGAKGSVILSLEKNGSSAVLKCQVLASLILPAKKLVDSEMISHLEKGSDGCWRLIKHQDNDFKTEIRRLFELKEKLIETKYIKFDEERGYIDYPAEAPADTIFDPLLALYLLRNPALYNNSQEGHVRVLLRTGILNLSCILTDAAPFKLLQVKSQGGVKVREPFLSPSSKILVEDKTGIISEITYPVIGRFGKLTLKLQAKS